MAVAAGAAEITSEAELRELLGDPVPRAITKERTIAIPDRPGNRRADGFRNILENPHVGLIVLIPGRKETLEDLERHYGPQYASLLYG
jgi:predicted pyridoxine 5'-phosphate oxidase superfamily flavin-nucleotide-binding protein